MVAGILAFTSRTAIYRTTIVAFTSGLVISPLITLTRRWWTLLSKRLSSALPRSAPSAKDFAAIDCLVFDCDGVLYRGKSTVAGGPAALTALRQAGKRLLFVTNAASVSRAGLAAKLTKMGYAGIEAEHCVTSGSAAATHLHTTRPDVKTAYVIGGGGLVEELSNVGIASVGPGTSAQTDRSQGLEDMVREGWSVARDGAAIGAVVCGALSDGLGYACIAKAAAYVRDPRRASSGRTLPCIAPRDVVTL
jgi:ribonucleotide monophosphatase NagD (HAD superfamily)